MLESWCLGTRIPYLLQVLGYTFPIKVIKLIIIVSQPFIFHGANGTLSESVTTREVCEEIAQRKSEKRKKKFYSLPLIYAK